MAIALAWLEPKISVSCWVQKATSISKILLTRLQILNVENNKLGDRYAILILKELADNSSLVSLNLSRNQLTDKCAPHIKTMFDNNT